MLIDMHEHMPTMEDAKLAMGYGIPKTYPLGINGFGDFGISPQDCEAMLNDPKVTSKQYIAAGCSEGGSITPNAKFNSFSNDAAPGSWSMTPASNVNPQTNRYIVSASAVLKNQPNGSSIPVGANGAQKYVDMAQGFFASLAPFFQKAQKQKTVVQRDPDYTTYAVIGGAVVVACVLAVAVGKSGRRKD